VEAGHGLHARRGALIQLSAKRFHQNRTASGCFTYIITTGRIASGDEDSAFHISRSWALLISIKYLGGDVIHR
jgi:hypothetical protein